MYAQCEVVKLWMEIEATNQFAVDMVKVGVFNL